MIHRQAEVVALAPSDNVERIDAITLEEVKKLEPRSAKLRESKQHPGSQEVLDEKGTVIALAVRTAPSSDGVVGYKGPSDTFMLMDASGTTLRGIALRGRLLLQCKSFSLASFRHNT